MDHNDEHFTPESVDEQIDQFMDDPQTLAPSDDAPLLRELQSLYQDDARRLAAIWDRFMAQASVEQNTRSKEPIDIQSYQQHRWQGPPPEQSRTPARRRTSWQRIGLLLAELVAVLIIASVLVVPALINHQTASPGIHTSASDIYMSSAQSVIRVDSSTGHVIWRYSIPNYSVSPAMAANPLVANNIVYAESQDSIYAINATTGALIWSYHFQSPLQISPYTLNKSQPLLAGNILYVAVVNISIYAFDAASGNVLHTYPLNLQTPVIGITLEDNVLYANALSDMCAIDLLNGQVIWHVTPDQMLRLGIPHILNGVIYTISSTDVYWPDAQGDDANYIDAFDAANGTLLWRSDALQGTISDLGVTSDALYAGTTDGSVIAYATGNVKKELWERTIPGVGFHSVAPVVDAGTVYMEAENTLTYTPSKGVYAFDVSNGNLKWSFSGKDQSGLFDPPLAQHGILYITNIQGENGTSRLYALKDGSVVWQTLVS